MYIIMDVESIVVKSWRVEPQRSGVERWGPEAALPHMGAFSDGLTMASIDLTKSMINLDKGEGRRRLELDKCKHNLDNILIASCLRE